MQHPIDLSSAQCSAEPFPHFSAATSLESEFATKTLEWLENGAPWKLKIADFYEQYEFSLFDADIPKNLTALCECSALAFISQEMGRLFGTTLSTEKIDVTAHKLLQGQRIRIHNDYIAGQETHRLLIQLNRGWTERNGGLLLLFSGPSPEALSRIVHPLHQSALGFEISANSQHAVAPVVAGERFTLVYSFYAG